jgi:DNA-binding winged helix-turn-helix (wHTH) protein
MGEVLSIVLLAADPDQATALVEQLVLDQDILVRHSDIPLRFPRALDAERVDLAVVIKANEHQIVDLRAAGYRGPILALGEGFNGMDGMEHLTLPVRFSLLMTRIRGIVRSFEAREDPWLTIGRHRLLLSSKQLQDSDGKIEKLTDKEADILRFMHRAAGEIVAREVLLTEIWGYNDQVTTHTLETHIYRLRQKIERDPANAELLVTEIGGYRLVENPRGESSDGA